MPIDKTSLSFLFQHVFDIGKHAVDVARTERYNNLDGTVAQHVKQLSLAAHNFVCMVNSVENDFGGNPFDRLFARRINVEKNHFVEFRKASGKFGSEIAGARIEMWLKNPVIFLSGYKVLMDSIDAESSSG